MLQKFKIKRAKQRFDKVVGDVRQTAPLARKPAPLKFVSLMCQRDIDPYLVAIKSVYAAFGEGDIVLVNDGSLTVPDIDLLERHLGDLTVIPIAQVDTGACPRGGCWERLATLIGLSADAYTVQVDADTVTTGPIRDAVEAYRANRPFTLSNIQRPGRVTFSQMSQWIAESSFGDLKSVQVIGENLLKDMPDADNRFYVRASAAFTGFPKGAMTWDAAERFSVEMEALMGQRWHEWGTEQFASNAMVAAAGDTLELAGPSYVNHYPDRPLDDAEFVHFFGTYRFMKDRYTHCVKDYNTKHGVHQGVL